MATRDPEELWDVGFALANRVLTETLDAPQIVDVIQSLCRDFTPGELMLTLTVALQYAGVTHGALLVTLTRLGLGGVSQALSNEVAIAGLEADLAVAARRITTTDES